MGKFQYYGFGDMMHSFNSQISKKKILKKHFNELSVTAAKMGISSLSMNQYISSHKMFIMLKSQFLKNNLWNNYAKLKANSYKCYANPQIIDSSIQQEQVWQQCASYPGIALKIKRSQQIKVKYYNEDIEEIMQNLKGFQSFIFQHEMTHIKGQDLFKNCLQIKIQNEKIDQKSKNIVMQKWLNYKNVKEKSKNQQQIYTAFILFRRDYMYRIVDQLK